MATRLKKEEKNEKLIRALSKLNENKKCINCNTLVPQYVCTNFWTFVCLTCSGIHREFTHRVKSISMSKFTATEVTALHSGGNEQARQIYLKNWDFQNNGLPDSSNVERLRTFIKQVYVERRYVAEGFIQRNRAEEKLGYFSCFHRTLGFCY
jgi:Arf-GAP domain and FG repeat-containing protein 1